MACPINLYDQLNIGCPNDPFCSDTLPIDGEWTLYSSPVGYPITLNVDGSYQLIQNDTTQVGTNYQPVVDLANLPFGDYRFEYAYGDGCKQTAYLDVIGLPVLCDIDALEVIACNTLNSITLYSVLTQATSGLDCQPTPYGNWSVNTETGLTWVQTDDGDGTNDTIDTETTSLDTPYIFTYTYHDGNIEDGTACEECLKTVQMTLTIADTPSAGSGGDVVVC